jgi:hypothetical protein
MRFHAFEEALVPISCNVVDEADTVHIYWFDVVDEADTVFTCFM